MKLDKATVELLRAKQCVTLKALAKKAGISQSTINIGFKKDIQPLAVGKLAAALGVEPEDIIVKEEQR